MKDKKIVTVTGSAGQISYSLLFRIASGELFGKDVPIQLNLLEITPALDALKGVVMELEDCAFPLVQKIAVTDDCETAFKDSQYAFLIGSRPRSAGMERKDLLEANAGIFSVQGKAINDYADRDIKVLVVGNPANTNCLITYKNASDLKASQFNAMTRLDHNRGLAMIANKTNCDIADIENFMIWGNHSSTQYPDLNHVLVKEKLALNTLDQNWFEHTFIPQVQNRGTAVIKARGSSSAASAANAALDHMHDWYQGSDKKIVSVAKVSEGEYGVEKGLVYSVPCVGNTQGQWEVQQQFSINQFSQTKIDISEKELLEEQKLVKHLL